MVTKQNAARAARFAGNINQVYSGPSMATRIDTFSEEFTFEATDVANSYADCVPFTLDGYLDLENSRIRIGGLITPTLNNTVKLQKVIGVPEIFSATTTSASTAVTTDRTGLLVGQTVTGTGIPAATTIAAITAAGFTLSQAATASGTVDVTVSGVADITAAATVAATAATAATAAQAVPFVPINGGPPVGFKKGDNLRLVLASVTSLGIGRTLLPSIPFISRLAPGVNP